MHGVKTLEYSENKRKSMLQIPLRDFMLFSAVPIPTNPKHRLARSLAIYIGLGRCNTAGINVNARFRSFQCVCHQFMLWYGYLPTLTSPSDQPYLLALHYKVFCHRFVSLPILPNSKHRRGCWELHRIRTLE